MTHGPACSACAGLEAGPDLVHGAHRYRVCAACGTASLDPLPAEGEARALYGRAYFEGGVPGGYADYARDDALHRRNARLRLRAMARAGLRAPGRLVDVGCATGSFLAEGRDRGFEVVGVDVSGFAREAAAARGFEAHAELAALPDASADAVCLSQVLEHARDPAAMLADAARVLRAGGLLFVETWDRSSRTARLFGARWQQIHPPTVLHLFSARGLAALLLRSGLEDVHKRRALKLVSVGLVGKLAGEQWGGGGGRLGRRLAGLALPYFLDDLGWWTARRAARERDAAVRSSSSSVKGRLRTR